MIVVKGKHSVLEALHSDITIRDIVIVKPSPPKDIQPVLTQAQQQGIAVRFIDKREASKRPQLYGHHHVFATIAGIPTQEAAAIDPIKHPILIACDHLEDPHNVGAIMRSCEGLGASGIIVPRKRQAPLDSGVVKASSGAAYFLPIFEVSNIAQTVRTCIKKGYWIYATDAQKGVPLATFAPAFPLILVVGNEHRGVSKHVSSLVHTAIRIPMNGRIDSLNVSVATGIILHHCMQHSRTPS